MSDSMIISGSTMRSVYVSGAVTGSTIAAGAQIDDAFTAISMTYRPAAISSAFLGSMSGSRLTAGDIEGEATTAVSYVRVNGSATDSLIEIAGPASAVDILGMVQGVTIKANGKIITKVASPGGRFS
jgi:hypothetical protein